jgi:hypothetical protein
VGLLIGPVASVLTGPLHSSVQFAWRSGISGRVHILSPQGRYDHTRDLDPVFSQPRSLDFVRKLAPLGMTGDVRHSTVAIDGE